MKKWVVHFPHLVRFWFSRILKLHIFEKNGWENPGKFSNPTRQKILELSWIAKKNAIFLGTFFPIPKKPMNLRPGGKWIEKKWKPLRACASVLKIVGQRNFRINLEDVYWKWYCFFFVTSECPKKCWNVGMFNMQKRCKKIRCNKNDNLGTFQRPPEAWFPNCGIWFWAPFFVCFQLGRRRRRCVSFWNLSAPVLLMHLGGLGFSVPKRCWNIHEKVAGFWWPLVSLSHPGPSLKNSQVPL